MKVSKTEVYSRPCQIPIMELFAKIAKKLLAVECFTKIFHHRYLTWSLTRLRELHKIFEVQQNIWKEKHLDLFFVLIDIFYSNLGTYGLKDVFERVISPKIYQYYITTRSMQLKKSISVGYHSILKNLIFSKNSISSTVLLL